MEVLIVKILKFIKFFPLLLMVVYYWFFDRKNLNNIIHTSEFQDYFDAFCYSFYAYMVYVKIFIDNMSFDDICHNFFIVVGGFATLARLFYTANIKRLENRIKEEQLKEQQAVNKFQKEVFEEASKK